MSEDGQIKLSISDLIKHLEQKIDNLSSSIADSMAKLTEELNKTTRDHGERIIANEIEIERLKTAVEEGRNSRSKIHARVDGIYSKIKEIEAIPARKALEQKESNEKTARSTVIRTVITVLLSALAAALVLVAEKSILGL